MLLFRNKPASGTLSLRQEAEHASAHLSFLMAGAERAAASILHGEHRQRRAGSGELLYGCGVGEQFFARAVCAEYDDEFGAGDLAYGFADDRVGDLWEGRGALDGAE